jgi:hypothetical protein
VGWRPRSFCRRPRDPNERGSRFGCRVGSNRSPRGRGVCCTMALMDRGPLARCCRKAPLYPPKRARGRVNWCSIGLQQTRALVGLRPDRQPVRSPKTSLPQAGNTNRIASNVNSAVSFRQYELAVQRRHGRRTRLEPAAQFSSSVLYCSTLGSTEGTSPTASSMLCNFSACSLVTGASGGLVNEASGALAGVSSDAV